MESSNVTLADDGLFGPVTAYGLRQQGLDTVVLHNEFEEFSGTYVAISHSGVTLPLVNARHTSRWIDKGEAPHGFKEFSAKPFEMEDNNVPAHH